MASDQQVTEVDPKFENYTPPFHWVVTGSAGAGGGRASLGGGGATGHWEDANGQTVPSDVVDRYNQTEKNRVARTTGLSSTSSDQYDPNSAAPNQQQFNNAVGTMVANTTRAAPAAPGAVTYNTDGSEQTRGQQQQNITQLQAAAAGQGPAADLARARLASALRAGGAQAAGVAYGATGQNRKAATLMAALGANQSALAAGDQVAQLEAQDRMNAQTQLANALQGARSQDLSQAGTAATVGAGNADRTLKYGDQVLQYGQLNEGAARDVVQTGNENEALKDARARLKIAEQQNDRAGIEYWAGVITNLLGTAARVVASPGSAASEPAKLAHGGIVTRPTHALVGEAGPEIILPVDNVPERLARALAVDRKPFDRADAPDLSRLLSALKGTGPAPAPEAPMPPKVIVMLAAGNAKARKESR